MTDRRPRLRSRGPGGAWARVVPAAVAIALGACGKDEPAPPPAPTSGWSVARVEGLPSPSGVAVVGEHLLFSSSAEPRLFTVPVAEVRGAGPARARPVPLEVDGEREVDLSDAAGPRRFRQRHLWDVGPAISGLAVTDDLVLYVVSEAFRLVWMGPLELDAQGAPARCTLQRAIEPGGARRTERGRSDWRDQVVDREDRRLAGIAVDGADLLVVERGRGVRSPVVRRLDRLSAQLLAATQVSTAVAGDDPATRGWTDVTPSSRVSALLVLARDAGGVVQGSVVDLPMESREPREPVRRGGGVLALPDSAPGEAFEGMTLRGGTLWGVRADGPSDAVVIWRDAR